MKIRGIVDINIFGKNDYTGTDVLIRRLGIDKIKSDYYSDLEKQNKIQKGQVKYAYEFFYGHIMHNKFCIIDNKWIWVGTVNISTTGTGGFNENVATIINSHELAKYYAEEFNQMFINGKFHENKKEIYTESPVKIKNSQVKLYFSPSKKIMKEGIIPTLQNAKKYIYVSMFLITNHKIAEELIKAKKRGVDVKLIIDAHHANQKYTLHKELRSANIPVKVENWAGKMHAKTAIIDDSTIISGSANWTSTAFKYNDENLSIYENVSEQAIYLRKSFLKSWISIPDKWLYDEPLSEGKNSKGSCMDGIDNNHNGKTDIDDYFCKNIRGAKKTTSYNYEIVQPHEK